jgi:selenide,water dikinase
MSEEVRLSQFSKGGGCSCKLRPEELGQILKHLPHFSDPNVLVGTEHRDDAAVYRLDNEKALVCTTDFFTPIVDDPYDFGRIAASNALSDIYAMGARPLMALNLVGFPARDLPMEILGKIIEGGAAAVKEAGAVLLGGHSIDDKEPKYGLAVVGLVNPNQFLTNSGGQEGDVLILTKPLGTGIIANGIKKGLATDEEIATVTHVMSTLNRSASEVFVKHREKVNALTDVTGFGLFGHLTEIIKGAGLSATIKSNSVPMMEGAIRLSNEGLIPGGTRANLKSVLGHTTFFDGLENNELRQLQLADAQTSGGLLACVSPEIAPQIVAELQEVGTLAAAVIGTLVKGDPEIRVFN